MPAGARTDSPRFQWWQSPPSVLKYGLTAAILMAAYYLIAATAWFDQGVYRLRHWNALASDTALHLMGQRTRTMDSIIRTARFSVNIRRGCAWPARRPAHAPL